MRDTLQAAVVYFQGDSSFHRLFLEMRKKYESLGKVGGSVGLSSFTEKELQQISLLGINLKGKKSISLVQFNQALQETKFEGVHLKQLLEGYFNEVIVSNAYQREEKEQEKEAFFQSIMDDYPVLSPWLAYVREEKSKNRRVYALYEENSEELQSYLVAMANGLLELPLEKHMRLPLFAQRVSGNPHFFDIQSKGGGLLLMMLQFIYCKNNSLEQSPYINSSEEITGLLQHFGILRDDILNFVTVLGFVGETNNRRCSVLYEAAKGNMVLNLPLREVIKLEKVHPKQGQKIYVVENSGVFSAIADCFLEDCPPMICTHGQFKLASLLFIDMLIKGGYTIYYSGDFDPEGLQMAQRMKQRSPENVVLWRYRIEDYEKVLSNEPLTSDQLQKLKSVSEEELQDIVMKMSQTEVAGYQEMLVDDLISDMRQVENGVIR